MCLAAGHGQPDLSPADRERKHSGMKFSVRLGRLITCGFQTIDVLVTPNITSFIEFPLKIESHPDPCGNSAQLRASVCIMMGAFLVDTTS